VRGVGERPDHVTSGLVRGAPAAQNVDRSMKASARFVRRLPPPLLRRGLVVENDQQVVVAVQSCITARAAAEQDDLNGIEVGDNGSEQILGHHVRVRARKTRLRRDR
jgi:hypothetical protein